MKRRVLYQTTKLTLPNCSHLENIHASNHIAVTDKEILLETMNQGSMLLLKRPCHQEIVGLLGFPNAEIVDDGCYFYVLDEGDLVAVYYYDQSTGWFRLIESFF